MLWKLLSFLLIISVVYVLLIFNIPGFADKSTFNKNIYNFKETFNTAILDIPTREEVKETFNSVKGSVVDGLDYTKEKVDTMRVTFSWAENVIGDWKEFIDNGKEFIDNVVNQVDNAKTIINATQDVVNTLSGAINPQN